MQGAPRGKGVSAAVALGRSGHGSFDSDALPGMTEAELEFMAEDADVGVLPQLSVAAFALTDRVVGPLRPNIPVQVPLWVALQLKRARRARIQAPHWLQVDMLEEMLHKEKETEQVQMLPHHFYELTTALLKNAPDDLPNPHQLKILVNAIERLRASKLRSVLADLKSGFYLTKFNNIAPMELNRLRSYVVPSLDTLQRMSKTGESQGQSQTQSQKTPQRRILRPYRQ